MGDKRRFNIFADFIEKRIPKNSKIADVASGKGYLSLALRERGFTNIIAFEPQPRKYRPYRDFSLRVKRFEVEDARNFDVVLGLHPDGASEEIIFGAAKFNKQMFVVPCCITPTQSILWKQSSYGNWIEHLKEVCVKLGLNTKTDMLKMNGRNLVLFTGENGG